MKFLGFTDIAADISGSIEITRQFNNIEHPFSLYSPKTRTIKEKFTEYEEGDILYHCVDHLPAEIPIEASKCIGESLLPFIEDIIRSDAMTKFRDLIDLPEIIKKAIVCCNGRLTPNFRYINQIRRLKEIESKESEEFEKMKKKSKGLKR